MTCYPKHRSGAGVVNDRKRIELKRAFGFRVGAIELAKSWKQ
jgi:hypothetical protein